MEKVKRESLGPGDWAEAALEALARGGLAAVAVEPLAKALGTTKGSFYWHFADRNALLEATLHCGRTRDTDRVIAAIDESQDVVTRLRNLLGLAFFSASDGRTERPGTVELALQASAADPLVAVTLERVTKRRLALLTRLFTELGLSRTRPATAAYSPTPHSLVTHNWPTRRQKCCRRAGRSWPTSTKSSKRWSASELAGGRRGTGRVRTADTRSMQLPRPPNS